jgi:hypothetical protein
MVGPWGLEPQTLRGQLLQFHVLRLGLLQDRNVWVGVLPKREEILIGRLGFGGVALHGVGSGDLETRQRRCWLIQGNARMIDQLFEFQRSCCPWHGWRESIPSCWGRYGIAVRKHKSI